MLQDIGRAVGQLGDPAFRSVLLRGVGLTVVLLIGLTWLTVTLVGWFVPETMTLPLIGEINWVDNALSFAAIGLMLVLSVFLMTPVASAFTSIFLDEVADAVEARHYASLPPAPHLTFMEGLRDAIGFLGVMVAANLIVLLLALVLFFILAPFVPFLFLGLNGYLLGREYFQLIALRRLGKAGARAARKRHGLAIWGLGILMALPLTIPVINLLVPVLGAAAFTHLFHRLEGESSG
ncbi:MAG: EI24 domain-containing protein [Pseudomonadota bacterium]